MHWMARGKVFGRIPAFNQHARLVYPFLIAEAVHVVAQIPGDIRECAQSGDHVAQVSSLILTIFRGLSLVGRNVLNYRNDHVTLARVTQHALPLLPVSDIEPSVIDARLTEVLRILRDPWAQEIGKVVAEHDGFAPEDVCRAG